MSVTRSQHHTPVQQSFHGLHLQQPSQAPSLNGALGLLKSSVNNFLKHPQAVLVRWLISRGRSASSATRPPRYTNWWTWLYFRPAAVISSAGIGGVGVSPGCCAFSGARIRRVSVFFSDTVKPNAPNTSTINIIILASPAGDLGTIPASSAYNIPHTAIRTRSSSISSGPPLLLLSRNTRSSRMVSSSLKRRSTTSITAAKKMLNSNGDSTHPCRSPCVTSNHSESSPLSIRTLDRIQSWNWRMTSIITDGTPVRASAFHNSSRSTELLAVWRSAKHMYSGIFLCRPSFCSRWATNSMSMVDHAGWKPHCSSGSICCASQKKSLRRLGTIFSSTLPAWETSEIPRKLLQSDLGWRTTDSI